MQKVANAVFGTHELLEMILSQLPSLNVLVLRRTNRTWDSVVSNSIQMQSDLYFLPSPKTDESEIDINPLLASRDSCAAIWSGDGGSPWTFETCWVYWEYNAEKLTKCLSEGLSTELYAGKEPIFKLTVSFNWCETAPAEPMESFPERLTKGSWRNMRLSRHPAARIVIDLSSSSSDRVSGIVKRMTLPPGCTIGDVVDWLSMEYTTTVASDNWSVYVYERDLEESESESESAVESDPDETDVDEPEA